jgi:cytoskeletal protein RodZ
MTLSEIASSTKLPLRTLEAIERNDISQLPGGIFSRSFIRSFAAAVGLDPQQTLREFMAQFQVDAMAAGYPVPSPGSAQPGDSERRRTWTLKLLIAVGVPMAVALFFVRSPATRLPPPPQTVAAASADGLGARPESVAPAPEPIPAPGPQSAAALDAAAQPPASGTEPVVGALVIDLVAVEPCWVSASADGVQVIRRELALGERQRINVRSELELTAGNAGGLEITLNGEEARPLGVRGRVVTVRITSTNFRRYLVAP